jgi:hypothetical protein
MPRLYHYSSHLESELELVADCGGGSVKANHATIHHRGTHAGKAVRCPHGLEWFFCRDPRDPFPFARARGCWGADSQQTCLPFGGCHSKSAPVQDPARRAVKTRRSFMRPQDVFPWRLDRPDERRRAFVAPNFPASQKTSIRNPKCGGDLLDRCPANQRLTLPLPLQP